MPTVHVAPAPGGLGGALAVPGDKSIAHRTLLLGALADGPTTVRGLPSGGDVRSSLEAVRALGARVSDAGDVVTIEGRGADLGAGGPHAIDCGNSGTTMRLVAGLAAGVATETVLDGDASLRR